MIPEKNEFNTFSVIFVLNLTSRTAFTMYLKKKVPSGYFKEFIESTSSQT